MTADLREEVVAFVERVLEAMGLSLVVSLDASPEGVRVDLNGDDGEVLLRRRGEALDALQHVVNTVYRRRLPEQHPIVVDCMDFRRNKDSELQRMTRLLMDRAKSSGEAQEIGPLNPYARRLVHLAVAEDPTMASESVGDAFLKTVIISTRG